MPYRVAALTLCVLLAVSAAPAHARTRSHARLARAAAKTHPAGTPYFIVTTRALRSEFQRLAAAHTKAGLKAEVATLEAIRADFRGGRDDAERIRMFLQDAHARHGLRWVLLGGNEFVIPVRLARVEFPGGSGHVQLVPMDQYYACLDGTWNADGDGAWGEIADDNVDLTPELIVGRAPVRTREEARRFVSRTIEELNRTTLVPERRSALLVAGAGVVDLAGLAEGIRPTLENDGRIAVTRLYENAPAWPGSAPESRAALIDSLDRGFDLALMFGAGASGVFATRSNDSSPAHREVLTATDAAGLTNDRPTRFYFLSANTCALDSLPSIGESLVNAPNGGGVAIIGPSRLEFVGLSSVVMRDFFRRVYLGRVTTVGEALTQTITHSVEANDNIRLSTQALILFGDPALPMRPAPLPGPPVTPEALADAGDPNIDATLTTAIGDPGRGSSTATRPAVEPKSALSRVSLAAPPRMSSSSAGIDLDIPASAQGASLEIAVFDPTGRRIRTLDRGTATAGRRSVTWDLRSDSGAPVKSGVYFIAVRVAGELVTGRVAVVR